MLAPAAGEREGVCKVNDGKPIVEVTEHSRRPKLDAGGYVESKNGKLMLRMAVEMRTTPVNFIVTKRWMPGDWPKEFYMRK